MHWNFLIFCDPENSKSLHAHDSCHVVIRDECVYVSSRFLKYFSVLISYDKTQFFVNYLMSNMISKRSDDQSCWLQKWLKPKKLKHQIEKVDFQYVLSSFVYHPDLTEMIVIFSIFHNKYTNNFLIMGFVCDYITYLSKTMMKLARLKHLLCTQKFVTDQPALPTWLAT